jgi:hypothetical protein
MRKLVVVSQRITLAPSCELSKSSSRFTASTSPARRHDPAESQRMKLPLGLGGPLSERSSEDDATGKPLHRQRWDGSVRVSD